MTEQEGDSSKHDLFFVKAYIHHFPACFGRAPFQVSVSESLNESNWVHKGGSFSLLYEIKL